MIVVNPKTLLSTLKDLKPTYREKKDPFGIPVFSFLLIQKYNSGALLACTGLDENGELEVRAIELEIENLDRENELQAVLIKPKILRDIARLSDGPIQIQDDGKNAIILADGCAYELPSPSREEFPAITRLISQES